MICGNGSKEVMAAKKKKGCDKDISGSKSFKWTNDKAELL